MGTFGTIRRGEIYYVERYRSVGSEQRAGRPAVVVSNNANNKHSSTIEVVYLTTQPKKELPTHVPVFSTGRASIALCEQIDTVSIERIGSYCGDCSQEEMEEIDAAMMVSLGLWNPSQETEDDIPELPAITDSEETTGSDPQTELVVANAQLAMMQKMYNSLVSTVVAAIKGV